MIAERRCSCGGPMVMGVCAYSAGIVTIILIALAIAWRATEGM